MSQKIKRILSPVELEEILLALQRLAVISEALGYPEDARAYLALCEQLKTRK
jgi:hypothetical protein